MRLWWGQRWALGRELAADGKLAQVRMLYVLPGARGVGVGVPC